MEKVNRVDNRDDSRRQQERRTGCRRIIKFRFGSEQWVKAVQSSYVLWPKQDRRLGERRYLSRRVSERRSDVKQYRSRLRRQRALKQYIQQPILTAEEKKLLNDLNRRT